MKDYVKFPPYRRVFHHPLREVVKLTYEFPGCNIHNNIESRSHQNLEYSLKFLKTFIRKSGMHDVGWHMNGGQGQRQSSMFPLEGPSLQPRQQPSLLQSLQQWHQFQPHQVAADHAP